MSAVLAAVVSAGAAVQAPLDAERRLRSLLRCCGRGWRTPTRSWCEARALPALDDGAARVAARLPALMAALQQHRGRALSVDELPCRASLS
jgi:hypothetical protein